MVTESAIVSLVGGTCSGFACTLLFQPLDLLKTRLQLSELSLSKWKLCPQLARTLWTGLQPSLVRTVPGVTCYFFTLSQLRSCCKDPTKTSNSLILGGAARVITVIVVQPLTVVKTRFESGKFGYNCVSSALRDISRSERLSGLYKGLIPTILRDAPYSGLYLAMYETLRTTIFQSDTVRSTLTAGCISGTLSSALTHPMDVIKTRIQVKKERCSVKEISLDVYREKGLQGFYTGIVLRVVRRTLVTATAWVIYEEVKKAASKHHHY